MLNIKKFYNYSRIATERGGRSWLYRGLSKKLFHHEISRAHDYRYLAKILYGKAQLAKKNRKLAIQEIREGKTNIECNLMAIDYIDTFKGCNMQPPCPKCYTPPPKLLQYMWGGNLYKGLEDFLATASYLQEGTQGEILMLPNFKKLLEATSQSMPRLCIVTNGLLLNSNTIEALVGKLNAICISLDSHHAEVYEKLQGTAVQFKKLVRSVRELVVKRNDSGSRFPLIQLACTLHNENIKDFENFCKFAADIGVDRVVGLPLLNLDELKNRVVKRKNFIFNYRDQVPTQKHIYQKIQRAKTKFKTSPLIVWEMLDQLGVSMCINDEDLDAVDGPVCTIPWTYFCAGINGNVSHCVWCDAPGGIGNWRKQGPRNIWNNHRMQEIRADILKFGIAKTCLVYGKGCPLVDRIRMFAKKSGKGSLLEEVKSDWSKAYLLLPFVWKAIENTARKRSLIMRDGVRIRLADIEILESI